MTPHTLEGLGPFVKRADGFGVSAVENLAAVAASGDETNFAKDAEMFGDRGLLDAESGDDVANGAFLESQEGKNVAAARFGDSVEGVGGCGGARHGRRIHSHMGICQEEFLMGG